MSVLPQTCVYTTGPITVTGREARREPVGKWAASVNGGCKAAGRPVTATAVSNEYL